MKPSPVIAVLGTYDSKAAEHEFLKARIEARGFAALTVNIGTRAPAPVPVAVDLYPEVIAAMRPPPAGRDEAIAAVLAAAKRRVGELCGRGAIDGIVSAGGGTGTHLATGVMRTLPLGFPKVMVSTVASRDMRRTVGTKDVVMMHSVVDILGVNSILGMILDQAAAAVCAMAESRWRPAAARPRIALPFFGFITPAAEAVAAALAARGYEVVPFHANGTGGMAMVELAAEGFFAGILELATHELADELKGGYCRGIGPERFAPIPGRAVPRLVVPGGLDCAVLEFTRDSVPEAYRGRKIFYYDFRSAIRLDRAETLEVAERLAAALNRDPARAACLIPARGWSEADREGGPLHDPETSRLFVERLRARLDPAIAVREVDHHINDPGFAEEAAAAMHAMVAAAGRTT
jgi:uncharacterized protein (UPF0261 family)